jgi:translation initiation factor IF-2
LPSSAKTKVAESRPGRWSHARHAGKLLDRLSEKESQTLNIILRADVRGSIEAIRKELTKLVHPEVKIKVLQATVGGISEADVHLADASDAIILGFNVVPDEKARVLAEQRGVQVRRYEIIYKLTADLKAALEGMLEPEKREIDLGRALVQRTFHDQSRGHDCRMPRAWPAPCSATPRFG